MWIALWIGCALLVAAHAGRRGFSPVAAFLLSVLLSPFVGWLIVTLLRQPDESRAANELLRDGKHKQCPACAEVIRLAALKCRYCGEQLDPASCRPAPPSSGESGRRIGYALGKLLRGK